MKKVEYNIEFKTVVNFVVKILALLLEIGQLLLLMIRFFLKKTWAFLEIIFNKIDNKIKPHYSKLEAQIFDWAVKFFGVQKR